MTAVARAEKSGIALEAQQKIHGKYDAELAGQILQWIRNIAAEDINTDGNVNNFISLFKDGSMLCKLANSLQPGSVKKVNNSTMAFKQMENIAFFLNFAEKHITKSELFQTVDLYEAQDPNAVLICLSALARKSNKLFGKPGLGPKEAEGEKREWTEAQLKAGQGVIGLQMGSNKGANASGLNFGNTRHI
uniref:Calponin-homology (CH) domain-containing protein n=1 Tax=Heterorhabditis bacteriophora TaxID=37862 RepID=A0A1I7XR54_HETBA